MENNDRDLNLPHNEETIDLCPGIISFQTDMGSVYEKMPDGTFRRHKYDGTEYTPMEWTMFTDNIGYQELQWVKLKQTMPGKVIFFLLAEYDKEDNFIKKVGERDEIIDINDGFELLTYEKDGLKEPKLIMQTLITFKPKVGYSVFEFSSGGNEYHHGDIVSKIETKET